MPQSGQAVGISRSLLIWLLNPRNLQPGHTLWLVKGKGYIPWHMALINRGLPSIDPGLYCPYAQNMAHGGVA